MSFSSTDYAVYPHYNLLVLAYSTCDLILTLTSARRGSHAVLIDCIDQGLKREAKARRREDGGRAPPSVAAWGLKRGATFSDEEREGDAKRSARVATRSSQRSKASFWRF